MCSTYFRAITSQELLYRLPNLYNLQNYMKFLDKVVCIFHLKKTTSDKSVFFSWAFGVNDQS